MTASEKARRLVGEVVSAYLGGNTVRTVDRNSPRFKREQKARGALEVYVSQLEAVAGDARAWYEAQRGTMASQSPTGLRLRDSLAALDADGGAT